MRRVRFPTGWITSRRDSAANNAKKIRVTYEKRVKSKGGTLFCLELIGYIKKSISLWNKKDASPVGETPLSPKYVFKYTRIPKIVNPFCPYFSNPVIFSEKS